MSSTRYLDRPDGRIAYEDSGGDAPIVLMLPGMGDLRAEYRFLVPTLLEAGYRAVTADLRGQGESSAVWPSYRIEDLADDLLTLVDHLDAGPAHVIGTSVVPGAMVLAGVARPEAFRSFTMIGAFVRDAEMSFPRRLIVPLVMNGPWKVAVWTMFYKSLYPGRQPEDLDAHVAALGASLREPGRFQATKAIGAASKAAPEARLGELRVPSLVVMGSADTDWPDPVAEASFISDAISGDMLIVEGAGHYPQAEMPEATNPAIVRFLKTVDDLAEEGDDDLSSAASAEG